MSKIMNLRFIYRYTLQYVNIFFLLSKKRNSRQPDTLHIYVASVRACILSKPITFARMPSFSPLINLRQIRSLPHSFIMPSVVYPTRIVNYPNDGMIKRGHFCIIQAMPFFCIRSAETVVAVPVTMDPVQFFGVQWDRSESFTGGIKFRLGASECEKYK